MCVSLKEDGTRYSVRIIGAAPPIASPDLAAFEAESIVSSAGFGRRLCGLLVVSGVFRPGALPALFPASIRCGDR
ncbi:hypothetical protein N183_31765 [Sinorhizobium sp. Sb3]|nr:hypothetical protein N183_31765 [Sinorhizobium sp. Sb3]